MTILDMLGQSGVLTMLGMGIVFSFLVIMVVCVTIMGKIIQALGLDKDKAARGVSAQAASSIKSTALTAAVAAAVAEYQKGRN